MSERKHALDKRGGTHVTIGAVSKVTHSVPESLFITTHGASDGDAHLRRRPLGLGSLGRRLLGLAVAGVRA